MSAPQLVRDAWRYREMVRQLVRRDLVERYRRSVAGVLLSLATPVVATAVLGLLFAGLMPGRDAAMYPLFVFVGYIAYDYLARVLAIAHLTLQNHAHLIGKVAFPIQVLPLATTLSVLVQLLVGTLLFLVVNAVVGSGLHATVLWLPALLLLEVALVTGLALAASAAGVLFRDYTHLQALLLVLLFYATPVFYDPSIVELSWAREAIVWNPMTSLVDALRAVTIEGRSPTPFHLVHAGGSAVLALVGGSWLFARGRDAIVEELG